MTDQDLLDLLEIMDLMLDAMETSASQTANDAYYRANRMIISFRSAIAQRLHESREKSE